MAWNSKFIRLGIASLALLAALAVYCFARIYPPDILNPFLATSNDLASHSGIFGSAPSLFYTLSLGLVIGVCASSHSSARFHCLMWMGLCLVLEILQHPIFSAPFSSWLSGVLAESSWNLIGPYWIRGVFDPIDLIATLMGGLIALALIVRLPMEENDAGA